MADLQRDDRLRIAILAAGAAGMYCGSCIRDNALALALKRMGHDCVMIPLYTPVKTDAPSASIGTVFYGGVNTWLQHASGLFRHTPRALDWLLDRPWLLTLAGNYGAQTSPSKLGEFTLDILRGEMGKTGKELRRLIQFLNTDIRPQVISMPNLMFIGAARLLKNELKCPVVMELTGEDIFLNAMAEPHKTQARDLIRERAKEIDRFVATSRYYADEMAMYMDVPREKIDVVYPGVPAEYLAGSIANHKSPVANPAVGYLARICPEKGFERLVDAMLLLIQKPGFENTRLIAAGYLGRKDHAFFDQMKKRIAQSPLGRNFESRGEVSAAQKLRLMDDVSVFSTPSIYAEPKGMPVIESLARGTPVVVPHHGAYPELVEITGGGVTVPPGDAAALADALADMLRDDAKRKWMGDAGHAAVKARFLDTHMAEGMLGIFRGVMK